MSEIDACISVETEIEATSEADFLDLNGEYEIRVYVLHGYFKYRVKTMASALEHAALIAERRTYRRSNPAGEVEFHHVIKVKVRGEGLASEYPDEFCRT